MNLDETHNEDYDESGHKMNRTTMKTVIKSHHQRFPRIRNSDSISSSEENNFSFSLITYIL